jgi:hypothetical protein
MPAQTQHIVETRFCVRLGGAALPSPAWQRERLRLFEQFCLPSVAGQTAEDFLWALFCDEDADADVLHRLREHEAQLPSLRVVLTRDQGGHRQAVDPLLNHDARSLITTRLDSDDAISTEYLAAVQAYAEPFVRSQHRDLLVNFAHGYRLDARSGEVFAARMTQSTFHSLLERPGRYRPKTVMHSGHGRIHYEHMTHQDESLVRWLIVVHGGNLVNRIRRELPRVERPREQLGDFSLAYDSFTDPIETG